MIENIIDELVESLAKVVCSSDKAPLALKAMSKLSILSSRLPVFGDRMNSSSIDDRKKCDDEFNKILEYSDLLIGEIEKVLVILPKKKVDDVVDKPEDTLGIRFLGKGTDEWFAMETKRRVNKNATY